MAKRVMLIGAGGFAKEVVWLALDSGFSVEGILDDSKQKGEAILDAVVLGRVSDWRDFSDCSFVIAVGDPRVRKKLVDKMESTGSPVFETIIHPRATVSSSVTVGDGSIITAGCVITTDIVIGKHCIVNLNTTIGHDAVIKDFCTIAPMVALSGNVLLEGGVEVGTGACVRQGVSLGSGSMLGMGAVLTKDIPSNEVFVGNPAKKMTVVEPFYA